jgi:hypothetical protein
VIKEEKEKRERKEKEDRMGRTDVGTGNPFVPWEKVNRSKYSH